MDPFSLVGIIILVIILMFLGKIMSFIGRVLFVALIMVLIVVLVFGISLDQMLNWFKDLFMFAF